MVLCNGLNFPDDDDYDDDSDEKGGSHVDQENEVSEYEENDDDDDDDDEVGEEEGQSNEEDEDSSRLSEDEELDESRKTRRRESVRKNIGKGKMNGNEISNLNCRKRRLSSASSELKSRKSRRTRLKVNYNEDFEDESSSIENSVDSEEDSNQIIGISSRGRIRKAAVRYADFVES